MNEEFKNHNEEPKEVKKETKKRERKLPQVIVTRSFNNKCSMVDCFLHYFEKVNANK